jgi:hypothetical protein
LAVENASKNAFSAFFVFSALLPSLTNYKKFIMSSKSSKSSNKSTKSTAAANAAMARANAGANDDLCFRDAIAAATIASIAHASKTTSEAPNSNSNTQSASTRRTKKKKEDQLAQTMLSGDDSELSDIVCVGVTPGVASSPPAYTNHIESCSIFSPHGTTSSSSSSSTPARSVPPYFLTPDSFLLGQVQGSESLKNGARTKTTYNSQPRCLECNRVHCCNVVYGGFIEASLDNLALANNKETLSHTEVYKHFYQCYNILTQFKSYNDNNGNIERGVLAIPTCLYKGTYLKLINAWNGVDEDSISKGEWEEELKLRKRNRREKMKRRKRRMAQHDRNFCFN